MKRIISGLLLVSMASMTAVACSGDDDDSAGSAGSSSKSGSGNTAGSPAENGGEPAATGGEPGSNAGAPAAGGASSGNVACDPAANTTCQNDMDCPFVADGEAREAAQTCGKSCLGNADKNCSRDCILEKLAMTSSCATCYADFVACTVAKCLGPCLADPNGAACLTCQEEKGCRAAFNDCSGLTE